MSSQPPFADLEGVTAYFTDVEYLRSLFQTLASAPTLPKRILIIHGIGGVGKSSLLRMFRLHCKDVHIPVALTSSDEAKSAMAVLSNWASDLKADGLTLSSFTATLQRYYRIQARVNNQAQKWQGRRSKVVDFAGKIATKTTEAAAGAVIGAAVGSVLPGMGTFVGALGGAAIGTSAEEVLEFLRSFLAKPDIDLLREPMKSLTRDFLADIAQVAPKKRVVLMLDTFDQPGALDDWLRPLVQRLHANVLMVIAGRAIPNWHLGWQDWLAQTDLQELKPMSKRVMHELVHRYYATLTGGKPDSAQVKEIIRFARGLPIAVASAVRLWVMYHIDFRETKAESVGEVVRVLIRNVPRQILPVLEAAAVVRFFNKEILRAVTRQSDLDVTYDELRRHPFVIPRRDWLQIHDSMREILDEGLQIDEPERHRILHERAATYFEAQISKRTGDDTERFALERLYHRIRADEEAGIKLFQEMAEELTRYRLVSRLHALLNDANTYALERENSKLWRKYYNAKLKYLEMKYADAAGILQEIGNDEHSEPRLRSYALCDLGGISRHREYVRTPGGEERAIRVLESVFEQGFDVDPKSAIAWTHLADVFIAKADWDKALSNIEKARVFFSSHGDSLGMLETLRHELGVYARQGDLIQVNLIYQKMQEILRILGQPTYLRSYSKPPFEWVWMGRFASWEKGIRPALGSARSFLDEQALIGHTRDLGIALALQGKCTEAIRLLEESLSFARKMEDLGKLDLFLSLSFSGIGLLICGNLDRAEERLLEALALGQRLRAHLDFAPYHLAVLYETQKQFEKAEGHFRLSYSDAHPRGRGVFECAAITGLVRVKHAQGDLAAIPPLLAEAEQLAQRYEYNNHLASLQLTQGHIACRTNLENLSYYKHALIYALRYNRFLLDEVLSGRSQGTPLRPIVPSCLTHGEEGRKMLIALRDWWRTGKNDVGAPRHDTISPVPEGMALLEAERIVREREPGDGSLQQTVVEQIEAALE